MRYLCVYKSERDSSAPPTQEEMTKMGQLIGEMTQAGVLLATEGCKSSKHGARVTIDNGKFTVNDGPFTEAKEFVGGLADDQGELEGGSHRVDEAVPLGRRRADVSEILEINEHAGSGTGQTELRRRWRR